MNDIARNLMKRTEDRDRKQPIRLCPRPICDRGRVYDTANGRREGRGYTCSVCDGLGFVAVRRDTA
jgi:hypothetical protein